MRNAAIVASILFLPLALGACGRQESSSPAAPQPAAAGSPEASHATAGVEPGSHEDWCGEHEVPESQCTRCNPTLIAAFKATGDWCAEHGLPESHCRACNPDLKIERPPEKEKP